MYIYNTKAHTSPTRSKEDEMCGRDGQLLDPGAWRERDRAEGDGGVVCL